MWAIDYTKKYESWFAGQKKEHKIAIAAKVLVLSEFGPNLPRPYVDTIQGSKYPNLKELRIQHKNAVFMVLFIFNKKREAWLLIGGNKKGKNEEDFYKKLVKEAEGLLDTYPEILGSKK